MTPVVPLELLHNHRINIPKQIAQSSNQEQPNRQRERIHQAHPRYICIGSNIGVDHTELWSCEREPAHASRETEPGCKHGADEERAAVVAFGQAALVGLEAVELVISDGGGGGGDVF